jgi:MscS family membrane protein
MENFFHYQFLDNSIEAYLSVALAILLVLFIKRLISRFLAGKLLGILIHRQESTKTKAFLNLVVQPIERFLFVFITYTALDRLRFPSVLTIKLYHDHLDTANIINAIGIIIIVVVFIRLCIRFLDFVAQILEGKTNQAEYKTGNQLIVFFKDFLKVIFIIIGILLILRLAFNKDISNLLTGLSIVGAALALAMKESLENLIASFIIFFDKPFVTGDLVKVERFSGVIEKIGLRSTRIRTENKTFISVPNKQMVDTIIDNITLRTERRVELRLELSLSTTASQLKQLIAAVKNILSEKDGVIDFFVCLTDTGRNAHILAIDYFTVMPQSINDFNRLREELNLVIIELLENSKIELAAQSSDVVVHQSI